MIDVAELQKQYTEKLHSTGSFDAAFKKAVWAAFKAGVEAGKKESLQGS